nr:cysteine-rich secretory protein 3 isoform X2 [Aotus nancymaae]
MLLSSSCTNHFNADPCSIGFVFPAMTLFPLLLFLVAGLLPSFPANGSEDSAFTTLSTTQTQVQREIVNKHNELRKAVSPPARNMLKMKWNKEAAANAQKWANMCNYRHSNPSDRKTSLKCGENLYCRVAPNSWSQVIQSWFDERDDFEFGVGPKTPDAVVGHYTQVVWYSSYLVGCGNASCPNQKVLKYYYVCHYCPAGNWANRLYVPYEQGSPCASCPDDCDDGLCTNVCKYEDLYSNCASLKATFTCKHQLVRDSCKASCNCTNSIY